MKMSKIFAGMSVIAMAAAVAAPVAADEAPVAEQFYNATGSWTMTYNGSDIAGDNVFVGVDPEGELTGYKGQLVGYTNPETGSVDTYNFGCSIQVGHMKKAKVTIKVTSSTGNIWDGTNAVSEGYMYTVQKSWSGDAPADFQQGWKKYEVDEDGNQVMADGCCDLVDWNSGSTKFNGQWAQITLTDDNLSALTFEVTVNADEKTTWEYHPYDAEKPDEHRYILFNFGGEGCFAPASVDGSGNCQATVYTSDSGDTNGVVVDGDYINAQFGGELSPDANSVPDDSQPAESNNSNGGGTDSNSSKGSSSGGNTSSGKSNTSSNKSSGGSNGGSKTSNTTKSTSTSSTGDGTAASDATENAESGAAAGVGLAFAAIAGAAMVVTRKK